MIKKTLYFGNPAYLSLERRQLVIKLPGVEDERVNKIPVPIEDIALIILDHSRITISHKLIQKLQESNVAIVSCNDSHMPSSQMLPYSGHALMTERLKKQIEVSISLKRQLWKQTVECKIKNQAGVLEKYGKNYKRLKMLALRVESGDPHNVEGRAASYYWKELFGPEFKREREGESPNMYLNYAYAIIRASVARGLVSSGMHPTLGLFHRNKYNVHCLADDIMEPYRPFVDDIVYDLYLQGRLESNELEKEIKVELLKVSNLDVIISKKQSPLQIAISRTTNSLYECYEYTRRRIVYPVF